MTERLTEKITNKETGEVLLYRLKGQWGEIGDNRMRATKKLGELEDAEEEGRLVVLPCDTVYFICDKGAKDAHVRTKSILDLLVYDINGIDKDGRYWSVKEEAEKALKEMNKNE